MIVFFIEVCKYPLGEQVLRVVMDQPSKANDEVVVLVLFVPVDVHITSSTTLKDVLYDVNDTFAIAKDTDGCCSKRKSMNNGT